MKKLYKLVNQNGTTLIGVDPKTNDYAPMVYESKALAKAERDHINKGIPADLQKTVFCKVTLASDHRRSHLS